jgi:hypothetical protein
MNLEELQENMKDIFKTSPGFVKGQSNKLEFLVKTYEINDIYEAASEFRSIKKRANFFEFTKELDKWVNKIKDKRKYNVSDGKDYRVKIIMNSIIDTLEYRTQKHVENKEITSYLDRSNYKQSTIEKAEKTSKLFKSFVILSTGEFKIIDENVEPLLLSMVNDWSWLNVGEYCMNWIKNLKMENVLYMVFSDIYFESYEYWEKSLSGIIAEPDLINSLIIKKYNELSKSNFDLDNEVQIMNNKLNFTNKEIK